MSFNVPGLELPDFLAQSLAKAEITTPTAIQLAAIPVVLAGNDVVIQSGTGTGKTLAYVLPLLQRVRADEKFRAVVMAPSPELAVQILRVVDAFKGPGISSCLLIGSVNADRQKDKLKQRPRIVVGTPGRVLEMIFAKKLKTAEISALVLDETDALLSRENERDLREIASRPEFKAQLLVVSATLGPGAEKLTHDLMNVEHVRLALGSQVLISDIAHHFMTFEVARKEIWLAKLIKERRIRHALVFVNKLQNVPHLDRFLNEHGIPAASISSERSKHDRQAALDDFKQGVARALVVTDTAARGLDLPGLEWVIHYDVARDAEVYVHRAGRTGRAGAPGRSVMMVAPNEMFLLKRYSEDLGIEFKPL